jgi:hypothetical protein
MFVARTGRGSFPAFQFCGFAGGFWGLPHPASGAAPMENGVVTFPAMPPRWQTRWAAPCAGRLPEGGNRQSRQRLRPGTCLTRNVDAGGRCPKGFRIPPALPPPPVRPIFSYSHLIFNPSGKTKDSPMPSSLQKASYFPRSPVRGRRGASIWGERQFQFSSPHLDIRIPPLAPRRGVRNLGFASGFSQNSGGKFSSRSRWRRLAGPQPTGTTS